MTKLFIYEPSGMDLFYEHHVPIKPGTKVVKTQPAGCPKNGTMGQCYIALPDGTFVGMRNLRSLIPAEGAS